MSFIVFEGIDHVGKTTQCTKLVNYLNSVGKATVYMRFPNRDSKTGQKINDYLNNKLNLDDKAIHELFSENRWEQEDTILRLLKNNVNIVCDRWWFSGTAYTMSKLIDSLSQVNEINDVYEWCAYFDKGLPKPSIVFYMTMPPLLAHKRKITDEKYETVDFQERVSEAFKLVEDKEPTKWIHVDAEHSIEDIHVAILNHLNSLSIV
jgi:dTMP kinase